MGQDHRAPWEAIVVASGDTGYLRELTDRWPRVKFVLSQQRLFSGQARNVGVKHSRGEVLIFLDSDCRPSPGWISAILEAHQKGFKAVCGALANGSPDSMPGTTEYVVTHSTYSPTLPTREISNATAASGNLSVDRDTFEQSGGFAGTYRANDFFFSLKLQTAGVRIVFWPGASVLCVNSESPGEFLKGQMTRGYWSAAARLESGSQGSIARKFPPLAFGLFPLRLYRLVGRCIRYRPVTLGVLAKTLPLASLGLLAWTWGFFKGALGIKNEGLEEREPLPEGWADFKVLGFTGEGQTG